MFVLDASIEVNEELMESIFSSNEIMVCDAEKLVLSLIFPCGKKMWIKFIT